MKSADKIWQKKIGVDILLLILVILFSFCTKYYHLTTNPAGFFADEAQMGYDAYNILKTGADRHGDRFPLFFKGFNFDNTGPFQIYPLIPFIKILGLNEFSVRLMPVTFSLLEILFFYLMLKEIIPKWFALFGTFLMTISPWHFHMSRNLMADFFSWTLLTIIAYYFYIKAFKNQKKSLYITSSIFFGLVSYSYTPARLIGPLVFFFAVLIILSKKKTKQTLVMMIVYLIISIPFISFQLTNPNSFQRIKDTIGIDLRNNKHLNFSVLSPNTVAQKYLLHYSDQFLFTKGDADFQGQAIKRHSISGLGLFYYYQKWFIILGVIWLLIEILKNKKIELSLILFLLLVFPLADSLTADKTPFATRSYIGIIPLQILLSIGIFYGYQIIQKIKNKNIETVFILFLIISSIISCQILFKQFNKNPLTTSGAWGWQYGPREIVSYFLKNKKNYDDLYMSAEFNGANIFYKFYDPQNTCGSKCKMGDFAVLPSIHNSNKKQLFSLSPFFLLNSNFKDSFNIKHIVYYPNGEIAFLIGEIKE